MTKEELKQKAYEYAIKEIPFIECITQNDLEVLVQQAYITGAEPREKQIEIDAIHIRALQKQNGELTDKVKELQAQIGKMKSCRICVSYDDLAISDWSPCKTCKNKSNWELSD